MMLHTGHNAYRLSDSKVWSSFTIVDPLKLMRISNDGQYTLTTNENVLEFLELDIENGFKKIGEIDTDNTRVYATCLLNSGLHGISLDTPQNTSAADQAKQTFILGCNRGNMYKFEKEEGGDWVRKGSLRLG